MLRVLSDERIGDTLRVIENLPQPVSRSCHIGNNGNYNFAWLALAKNTRFVMYDHTTYGADRVCFPWMLVRDYGIIDSAFDIDGHLRNDLRNKHVGTVDVPARYRSILNYGIEATVDNMPLFTYHYALNCELAKRHSNQAHTFDSQEVLNNFNLCEGIIHHFAQKAELHLLFDRWVAHRKGRKLMEHIQTIRYSGNDIFIFNTNKQLVFRGDIEALVDSLHEALIPMVAHITNAVPLPPMSYPWFNLVFSYLFGAATEYNLDSTKTSFFHAGGLTSPYYMNDVGFQRRFEHIASRLQIAGFLPQQDFSFTVIPIACCQLYACSYNLAPLEELVLCAREALHTVARPAELTSIFQQFQSDVRQDCTAMLFQRIRPSIRTKLCYQTLAFNSDSANHIPVCLNNSLGNTFTKYGVGGVHSRSLREDKIVFPTVLLDMTWSEGEWIVQVLGHLLANLSEDPDEST